MGRVSGEILILRPIDEVFDYVVDERNEPTFNPKMVRVDKVTEGPVGAGTRFAATMRNGRRETDMLVEYTEVDRPHSLASTTSLDSMRIEGRLRFEAVGEATRMSWDWRLEPSGGLRLLSPLVVLMGRRQEAKIWSGLKRILEGGR